MTYLSIIEKFIILFNMLLNFKFILVFSILFILLTLLYIFKVFNNKKYILFMFLSFIILFCISIFSNYETLSITFDDFSTLFFSNIYFPSIYVYVGILIIVFIAFIVSMFNMMLKRVYKIINSIMFVMNNILFVLILNIIAKNKIDIFSPNSLYTCTELVAILELSTGLFIVWLLSLVTVYVTNVICDRLSSKKVYNTNVEINTQDNCNIEIDINDNKFNDKQEDFCTNEVLVQTVSDSDVIENTIVDNIVNEEYTDNNVINDYIEIDTVVNNDIVQNIVLEDNVVEVEDNKNGMFNDILNGNIPAIYYDNSVIDNEYELIDPQKVYESRYNEIRRYTTMDVNPVSIVEDINVNDDTLLCINDDIAIENVVEKELLIHKKTIEEKEKVR